MLSTSCNIELCMLSSLNALHVSCPKSFHAAPAASVSVQVGSAHAMVDCMQEEFMQVGSANILDELQQRFDESQAIDRLQYIRTVWHVFQFSLNPDHEVISWGERGILSSEDDGFTFTMKAVMRNLCSRGIGGNIAERCSIAQHPQSTLHASLASITAG